MTNVIKSNFIADFKTGDNIVHNFNILNALYKLYKTQNSDTQNLLRKPIIIVIASIAEAILYDFDYRVKTFKVEGVKALSPTKIKSIQKNSKDKFSELIGIAQARNIFESKGKRPTIYKKLYDLNTLRNRLHIQNSKKLLERDETDVFTSKRLIQAEQTLESMLHFMLKRYERPSHAHHDQDFILPW